MERYVPAKNDLQQGFVSSRCIGPMECHVPWFIKLFFVRTSILHALLNAIVHPIA